MRLRLFLWLGKRLFWHELTQFGPEGAIVGVYYTDSDNLVEWFKEHSDRAIRRGIDGMD